MRSAITRLSILPKDVHTFQYRFNQLINQLEQFSGFHHYRLISRDPSGCNYILLTFWHSKEFKNLAEKINLSALRPDFIQFNSNKYMGITNHGRIHP